MKRFLACLTILAIVLLACNISTPTISGVTPQPGVTDTKSTSHKPTKIATETVSVTETDTPMPATNVSCNELSFYLDPTLASSIQCETIPQAISPTGIGTNPQYTKVSLEGYILSDRFMKPVISVFPLDKFSQLLPDAINADVTALQAMIAGGAPGSNDLPLLPIQYARQLFFAQYNIVAFTNGSGYHIVTEYAQAYYPINNHEMFFSYQGITSDGKYWISVILPISHPSLPENGDNPPADLYNNPDPYYAQMTSQLNGVLPKSFVPSIVKLNALIKSITITP
ncbi:MAG: hypothetical protein ABSC61_06370 [Anaerolineales bacterium]